MTARITKTLKMVLVWGAVFCTGTIILLLANISEQEQPKSKGEKDALGSHICAILCKCIWVKCKKLRKCDMITAKG
jgi:hypothetical protein